MLQFERRNYRQSGAPAESCRLRCFRYLSAIYRDNDICRYKLRRWSECVLLVAVGLWSDSGPQRSRAARTRGPGLQRPANALSRSRDRECSARQTHDRDTGSINTRSARGVATPKSHFGELDSSQDSSCRPLNDGGQQLEPSAFRVQSSRCGSGEATGPTTAAASRELRPQILFLGCQRPGASAPTRIQRQRNCAGHEASPMPARPTPSMHGETGRMTLGWRQPTLRKSEPT